MIDLKAIIDPNKSQGIHIILNGDFVSVNKYGVIKIKAIISLLNKKLIDLCIVTSFITLINHIHYTTNKNTSRNVRCFYLGVNVVG
jgi:hypothetical protein